MKRRILIIILVFISLTAESQEKQKAIRGFEFYASVNHPISAKEGVRTFYGGGIGANIIFNDTNQVSFKTGVEFNYFHTWDSWLYSGHFSNQSNIHYQYAILSIPAVVRFNMGDEFKLFLELGAYLGISLGGDMRSTYSTYDPISNYSFNGFKRENYFPGLSFTPMIGFGARVPLSERIDLVLKPEFAFMLNQENSESFNRHYFYARFCAGIHLK